MNSSEKNHVLDSVFWDIKHIKNNIYELTIHKLSRKHCKFDLCGHSVSSNLKIQKDNTHLFIQLSYKRVFATIMFM